VTSYLFYCWSNARLSWEEVNWSITVCHSYVFFKCILFCLYLLLVSYGSSKAMFIGRLPFSIYLDYSLNGTLYNYFWSKQLTFIVMLLILEDVSLENLISYENFFFSFYSWFFKLLSTVSIFHDYVLYWDLTSDFFVDSYSVFQQEVYSFPCIFTLHATTISSRWPACVLKAFFIEKIFL